MLKAERARERIERLYDGGDYGRLLAEHRLSGASGDGVLWPKPRLEDLHAIADFVRSSGKDSLLSVGCGSGLLESLIGRVTGLKVRGVEVNSAYWLSRYGPRMFLDRVSFPEDADFSAVCRDPGSALMFSYFNDREAFRGYLEAYRGDSLVLIGPDREAGRHTDPYPLDPEFPDAGWTLHASRPIGDTRDHIAFYLRTN